ncbi:oxoglutarate iron-dependent oxygenase [Fusarium sporotrichioides]|uniref:Oxoglutarate iron-dependent oxygenase n=1 Tax=Fusarium sporotrichioides TaxID=5514 RepID=A0A395RGZ6_FUSSP|nr:oxoglutarate iron-dependent oxygenase [Fusarium sporotrichioides]
MPNWLSLPPEIRNIILNQLSHLDNTGVYASVSKEWRQLLEKKNFSHLKLHPDCLDFLDQLSEEATAQIDHIWLNIELTTYTCRACRKWESPTQSYANDRLIVGAVSRLYSILARWNQGQRHLTLELNTYSPSDSEHWFKDCYFGAPTEDKFAVVAKPRDFHDPHHGWFHGRIVEQPPNKALGRPFVPPESLHFKRGRELPLVAAVTKFVLRRQCRRQLKPSALLQLWSKLPRLNEIQYESWQLSEGISQNRWDSFHEEMIRKLPRSVKKVTIFEDFNENYLDLFQLGRGPDIQFNPDRVRLPSFGVGAALARRSRELEHLSVAFPVDARDFFNACELRWRWDKLKSLTLTSRAMCKDKPVETKVLLTTAARVALRMPSLETMILWNGSRGEACSFTYCRRRQDRYASIVW